MFTLRYNNRRLRTPPMYTLRIRSMQNKDNLYRAFENEYLFHFVQWWVKNNLYIFMSSSKVCMIVLLITPLYIYRSWEMHILKYNNYISSMKIGRLLIIWLQGMHFLWFNICPLSIKYSRLFYYLILRSIQPWFHSV